MSLNISLGLPGYSCELTIGLSPAFSRFVDFVLPTRQEGFRGFRARLPPDLIVVSLSMSVTL